MLSRVHVWRSQNYHVCEMLSIFVSHSYNMCIFVLFWGSSVSLLSGFVCAQGFRSEWCQSESVSVVPASSASLKIDLSRRTERHNTPLRHLCLSLKNTKWDSPPRNPEKHPHPPSHFPHRQVLCSHIQTTSHTLSQGGGALRGLAQRGQTGLDGSRGKQRFLFYFVYATIKYGNKKRGRMFLSLPKAKLLSPASLSVCVFLNRLARRQSSQGKRKASRTFLISAVFMTRKKQER